MARLPLTLLFSAAALLVARGVESSTACASSSASLCWVGVAPGGSNLTSLRLTGLSPAVYQPAVDGAVCSCFNTSDSSNGNAIFGFGDPTFLDATYGLAQPSPIKYSGAHACTAAGCNCVPFGANPQALTYCPVNSTTYLTSSAALGGYTATTFGTKEAGQFQYAAATALGLSYSAVTVTSVAATTVRRSLLAAGVAVGFSVQTTAAAAVAGTLSAALAALNTTALKAGGMLPALTSVAVTPAPAQTAAPVAASALPNTGVFTLPGSSAASAAPAGVLAAVLALAAAALLA